MSYLKHSNGNKPPRSRPAKKTEPEQPIADANTAYYGLSEIAEQLQNLFKQIGAYAHDATIGEHSLNLFTATNSYPLRLELEGDAVESIADSLKRLADSLSRKSTPQG